MTYGKTRGPAACPPKKFQQRSTIEQHSATGGMLHRQLGLDAQRSLKRAAGPKKRLAFGFRRDLATTLTSWQG
jgi:hypothetical protein